MFIGTCIYSRSQVSIDRTIGPLALCISSESSMFVTERRFILKTCGTTTLLLAVQPLLQLVKDECGFDTVAVSNTCTCTLNSLVGKPTMWFLNRSYTN